MFPSTLRNVPHSPLEMPLPSSLANIECRVRRKWEYTNIKKISTAQQNQCLCICTFAGISLSTAVNLQYWSRQIAMAEAKLKIALLLCLCRSIANGKSILDLSEENIDDAFNDKLLSHHFSEIQDSLRQFQLIWKIISYHHWQFPGEFLFDFERGSHSTPPFFLLFSKNFVSQCNIKNSTTFFRSHPKTWHTLWISMEQV